MPMLICSLCPTLEKLAQALFCSSPSGLGATKERASPAPAELGVAGGCFTAEQTGSVCASDTWSMANCRNKQKFSKSL